MAVRTEGEVGIISPIHNPVKVRRMDDQSDSAETESSQRSKTQGQDKQKEQCP